MNILYYDLTNKSAKLEQAPLAMQYLGGRGLTSALTCAMTDSACHALGPLNNLIFAPGLLTGTSLVNTGRLSIGGKSPLTGGIKESNVGGTTALALARLGLGALVVQGSLEGLWVLHLDEEAKPTLHSASDLAGLMTYELCEKLFERFGPDIGICCIGPAGEQQMALASVQSTDKDGRPCRAAGRGGLGAVMGSKGLKAIVISREGKQKPVYQNKEAFNRAAKELAKAVKESPFSGKVLPELGTSALIGAVNSLGAFPSYNATQGVFPGWEKISGEALKETLEQRGGNTTHAGCTGCIIHCSNEYLDQAGKFVTSSLEYETIWSTGGMCGIDDLDAIAAMDRLCDEIGLDTIGTGVTMAIAMDAGQAQFGDATAAREMLMQIAKGEGLGLVLGQGPTATGRHLGHHRIPACKNQSIAAYDPRGIQGMSATYGSCPMGADHTAGNFIGDALAGKVDPLSTKGVAELSREKQTQVMGIDTLGICLFAMGATTPELLARLYQAKVGDGSDYERLTGLWREIIKQEIIFNRRAGLTRQDDRLPDFFYKEPLPPHNKTVELTNQELDSIWGID
ncbi:aldehyde ferredoxin oxidoreductase family protein [Dethiosulfatarculus sandiegensis]|uniref:Aldehyde:ferredoxin oxidoreductase n=1 Tax=Dethiosulfatarculus sandiegensis TaxID=1429043 RepID=A0A0D2JAM8_9BACT|nr:aldehyde ferredoxin oxidoreductase C-terminal domain-containing protein [Dethiosulfatarculus sandiegensis]KIX12786.1 aldehyde:ferredoxin oxidoreductase [Dethiosulfatarculus sandiegensis]